MSESEKAPSAVLKLADTAIVSVVMLCVDQLKPNAGNPRKHTRLQIRKIARSIEAFGFLVPILSDKQNRVIAGHGRLEAAKFLGLSLVPTIQIEHLTEVQQQAFMLADNKLTDSSSWDEPKLAAQLKGLLDLGIDLNFDIEVTGFDLPEIEILTQSIDVDAQDAADEFDASSDPPITKFGDTWLLGDQKIHCGNALDDRSYQVLLGDQRAAAVFTDPPYNVPVNGHVRGEGKMRYREFEMGSGEMSTPEFEKFLAGFFHQLVPHMASNGLIYACMDWRHMSSMLAASQQSSLDLLNVCVWVKTNGGMGSFYRSRHELVFVFRSGKSGHINNVQLGRFGRNRTNVWNYAGANSFARGRKADAFESHPTVKPIRLVSDALLDCTHRGDIVLDPFLGSGTSILAAEATGRRCYGIELDPIYVDTAIQRWERMTGRSAINHDGETFAETRSARNLQP